MCKECLECGAKFRAARSDAQFCCRQCRKSWHNRRAARGAELYDLWMANSYERELRPLGLFSIMSNLARAYKSADNANRNGRKSWNAKETLDRLPLTFGENGDQR